MEGIYQKASAALLAEIAGAAVSGGCVEEMKRAATCTHSEYLEAMKHSAVAAGLEFLAQAKANSMFADLFTAAGQRAPHPTISRELTRWTSGGEV